MALEDIFLDILKTFDEWLHQHDHSSTPAIGFVIHAAMPIDGKIP
jgi:hypothetical protein